ncbi:putative CENP-V/GFA domain-containing protein [Seiridium cardinale]|uniref:CENP-V/GFA domain-containing protein n=1 Tax=Seiridium cardinale TaxID=138064 RepID=A0ABR2XP11_9PEZI
MEARCQCGAVSFKTPLSKPLALYICHCAECRRQTSSAFGTSAIFPRFALPQTEELACYSRPTPSGHTLYWCASLTDRIPILLLIVGSYFCKTCGSRLLHTTPGKNVVSVKGGCLDGLDWKNAIHIWTKSAMVPIPEGSECYSEEPSDSEYSATQETLDQPGFLIGSGGFPEPTTTSEVAQLTKTKEGLCELSGAHSHAV